MLNISKNLSQATKIKKYKINLRLDLHILFLLFWWGKIDK